MTRRYEGSPSWAQLDAPVLDLYFALWGHCSPLGVVVCLTVYPEQLLFHFGLKLINQGDFGERNNSFHRICIILAGDMIMVFVKDRTQ